MYAMSNWYGMNQFPAVFDFHISRFAEFETVPVFLGGDFNAVPHTDGGDSPASRVLLDAGCLHLGLEFPVRPLHDRLTIRPGLPDPSNWTTPLTDRMLAVNCGLTARPGDSKEWPRAST